MSVFSTVGFGVPVLLGKPATHDGDVLESPTGKTTQHEGMAFTEALERLGNNFRLAILAKIMPPWFLTKFAPASLKATYSAYLSFGKHLQDMLATEEQNRKTSLAAEANEDGALARRKGSLLASLVHERHSSNDEEGGEKGFTDADIMGNLWIFCVAGHETTSNTLEYLVVAMAIHKDAQKWLCGELDGAVAEHGPVSSWDYERMPQLTAVLCCIVSTHRHFPVFPTT
jgi:hypothetical protein